MALDQDPTAKPQPPADVEGFLQQEARRADENAQEIADVNSTETTHAPEEPGVFSSPENGANGHHAIDQPYNEATDGPVVAPEAPVGANSIAEAAALYLKNNAAEEATDAEATTSTALDVVEPKSLEAPVNVLRPSAKTIEMPPVKAEPEESESVDVSGPYGPFNNQAREAEAPAATPPSDVPDAAPILRANPNKKRRRGLIPGIAVAAGAIAGVIGLGFMKSGPTESEQVSAGPVPAAGAENETATTEGITPSTTADIEPTVSGFEVVMGEPLTTDRFGHAITFADGLENKDAYRPVFDPKTEIYGNVQEYSIESRNEMDALMKSGGTVNIELGCVAFPAAFIDKSDAEHKATQIIVNPALTDSSTQVIQGRYYQVDGRSKVLATMKNEDGKTLTFPDLKGQDVSFKGDVVSAKVSPADQKANKVSSGVLAQIPGETHAMLTSFGVTIDDGGELMKPENKQKLEAVCTDLMKMAGTSRG